MKTNLFFSVAILAVLFFTACEPKYPEYKPPTPQEIGVEINGVVWAPYNFVGLTGSFEYKPEIFTGYSTWSYEKCPTGWRLPTAEELETLLNRDMVDKEWTTENDVNGRRFIDKNSDNSIFMPAAGFYNFSHEPRLVGEGGYYWSSTSENDTLAYALAFYNDDLLLLRANKKSFLSVRCVAE